MGRGTDMTKIVHFEIPADDPQRASTFYRDALGWEISRFLSRVESCGGKVTQGKLPVPGMGWSAYVLDSEGNTIGLFQQDTSAATGQA